MLSQTIFNNSESGLGSTLADCVRVRNRRQTPLTIEEKRDAELLRIRWHAMMAAGSRLSQKQLSGQYGVHASLISQLLNGYVALNTEWKMRFAQYMGLAPQELWPDWPYRALTAGPIPPSLEPIRDAWSSMAPEEQLALTTLLLRRGQPGR